jgi:hypothetical protein
MTYDSALSLPQVLRLREGVMLVKLLFLAPVAAGLIYGAMHLVPRL